MVRSRACARRGGSFPQSRRCLVIPASAERVGGNPEASSNGGDWGWMPALRFRLAGMTKEGARGSLVPGT
jgi:hypothetical protein